MPRVPPTAMVGSIAAEASAPVATRISAARRVARERSGVPNGRLSGARLRAACGLLPADVGHAARLAAGAGLSARGVERLLRVARTIADLEGVERAGRAHLDEAARYRVPVGPYAGRLAS